MSYSLPLPMTDSGLQVTHALHQVDLAIDALLRDSALQSSPRAAA